MNSTAYKPVVIIGAPRSGTNILRDVLTTLDGIVTWPCDEINYIWRHGNVAYPSDELPASVARPEVQRYIRRQFDREAARQNAQILIEKTCANSLRVPFVDAVINDARYIYIRRDGIDAAASARLRWKARLDLAYLARKARYVPPLDLPYYASRYLWARIYRLFSSDQRLAFWGPKLDDMDPLLERHNLLEVCALQWLRCVQASESAFAKMPGDKVMSLRYEDFVRQPAVEVERVIEFLGHDVAAGQVAAATQSVNDNSLGKARRSLTADELNALRALLGSYGD